MQSDIYDSVRNSAAEASKRHILDQLQQINGMHNRIDKEFMDTMNLVLDGACLANDQILFCCNILVLATLHTKLQYSTEQYDAMRVVLSKSILRQTKEAFLAYSIGSITRSLSTSNEKEQIKAYLNSIWSTLMRFANYKVFQHLLLLFCLIRNFLLDCSKELDRIMRLGVLSGAKLKTNGEAVEMIAFTIQLIKRQENSIVLTLEHHLKLDMILIVTLSKKELSSSERMLTVLRDIEKQNLGIIIDRSYDQPLDLQQHLIAALLNVLGTYGNNDVRIAAKRILCKCIQSNLSLSTVKYLIRKLEIVNESRCTQQWQDIFQLMSICLDNYPLPRQELIFQDSQSCLRKMISFTTSFTLAVQFKAQVAYHCEQLLLLALASASNGTELWITVRNHSHGIAIVSLVKIHQQACWAQQKTEVTWRQYAANRIELRVSTEQVEAVINNDQEHTIRMDNFLLSPTEVILGNFGNQMGSAVKSISEFSVTAKTQTYSIWPTAIWDNTDSSGIIIKRTLGFVQYVKALGDLDIFMLVISHTLLKLKDQQQILVHLRAVLRLMQQFVAVKNVEKTTLTKSERTDRLNNVLCLCWLASQEGKSSLVVLELLRFLTIRGTKNYEDILQVLCNFVFWKKFDWEYQKLIVMKIRETFVEINSLHSRQSKHQTLRFCKRILFEMVVFYREDELAKRDHLLMLHQEFLSLVLQQASSLLEGMVEQQRPILELLDFVIKLLSCTLNRSSEVNGEIFDLTLAIELSFFIRDLTKHLYSLVSSKKIKFSEHQSEDYLRLTSSEKQKQQPTGNLIIKSLEARKLFDEETASLEQSSLKIYRSSGLCEMMWVHCNKNVLIQNIVYFSFYLAALDEHRLQELIQDYTTVKGVSEIISVAWQVLFFDTIKLAKTQDQVKYLKLFTSLAPINSLSEGQLIRLLECYLTDESLFPEKNSKVADAMSVLDIRSLISQITNSFNESKPQPYMKSAKKIITSSVILPLRADIETKWSPSEIHVEPQMKKGVLEDKVVHLLISNNFLVFHDCEQVLEWLDHKVPSQVMKYLINHLILRELIENIKLIIKKGTEESELFFTLAEEGLFSESSQILDKIEENSTTDQTHISKELWHEPSKRLQRAQIIACLQFYLENLTLYDMMAFLYIGDKSEGEYHIDNFKINIECILNITSSCNSQKITQLKNFSQFLQKQLLKLSEFYLAQLRVINFAKDAVGNRINEGKRRKKSFKDSLQLVKIDIRSQGECFYSTFIDKRNRMLTQIEKVWSGVQAKNKCFWNTFITRNQNYSLHETIGACRQRYLLKADNQKPKLLLPKMARSASASCSIMSEKNLRDSETESSIFDGAGIYRREQVNEEETKEETKQKENNVFKVLLVTNAKIYQGKLEVKSDVISFNENEVVHERVYNDVCANNCERRSEVEIIKEELRFEVLVTEETLFVVKRYMLKDRALELYSENVSYFLCFCEGQRQKFLGILEKGIVINRDGVKTQLKRFIQKWEQGLISNFQYLMKINELSGRSFNDLSQYYIFPWTVINFKDQINNEFLSKTQNFRDLSQPVGKLGKTKWIRLKEKYQSNKRVLKETSEPYLYGSFYSNPAIVCNYLIRIDPFSKLHYELQSNHFDVADRLFFSVPEQLHSCLNNQSDLKQLIPEFYYFAEFLRNRNQYDLGSRQNKDIVHNVTLPVWASSADQFVFKMRKLLETPLVTKSLHLWIDLIFGVHSKLQQAQKADNLFLPNLYQEYINRKCYEIKECDLLMLKQFGQVPVAVFDDRHPKYKNYDQDYQSLQKAIISIFSLPSMAKMKLIKVMTMKGLICLVFDGQIRLMEQDKVDEKHQLAINCGGYILDAFWIVLQDKSGEKHEMIFSQRDSNGELSVSEVKKSLWKKLTVKDFQVIPIKCSKAVAMKRFLIVAEETNLHLRRNCSVDLIHTQTKYKSQFWKYSKVQFGFIVYPQFTLHAATIIHLTVCEPLSLVVSLDSANCVFVLKVTHDGFSLLNTFELKQLYLEETVANMLVHDSSLLIFRTNYNRLVICNFLGDILLAKHMQFEKEGNRANQTITAIDIWHHEFSELLLGTNQGRIWKVDVFELIKENRIKRKQLWAEPLDLPREEFGKTAEICQIIVERIGKHWQAIACATNCKAYVLKSKRFQEAAKLHFADKKGVF